MKPILCRPGGKSKLASKIVSMIPPHEKYVEPFFGGGAVFFRKPPSKKEIISDNDKSLMNFYRTVSGRRKLVCNIRPSRSRHAKLRTKLKTKSLGACDYLYLTKYSFGCDPKGGFNTSRRIQGQPWSAEHIQRLRDAQILTGDFKSMLRKHDGKKTFFYLDPPYYDTYCSYPQGSCSITPEEVAAAAKKVKGKVLVSYNDHPKVRRAFKGFKIKKISTVQPLKDPTAKAKELLISNY